MKPFRVLSLDGGGMRGVYSATYLMQVSQNFAKRNGTEVCDLGGKFDLIVGTSTGAIIGCGLAKGINLAEVVDLYKQNGPLIFQKPLPKSLLGVAWDLCTRKGALRAGEKSLREALVSVLGETTIGSLYQERAIALAIPAVEMGRHRGWVFKTPHSEKTTHRDDNYKLVDVCLATSAAPIYRSLTHIDRPDGVGSEVYCDGGLWANNPVLVALVEALELAEPDQEIQIFCLGTCALPAGDAIQKDKVCRGLLEWRFGSEAASLSIDAQGFAFDFLAKTISKHVSQDCHIVRFPSDELPASLLPYLSLDETRPEAMDKLVAQANADGDFTNSFCDSDDPESKLIKELFS